MFLAKYATIDKNIIIVGDLNIHLDIPTGRDSTKFSSTLEYATKQFVYCLLKTIILCLENRAIQTHFFLYTNYYQAKYSTN